MQNFRNLEVWKKSHALTLKVYESTAQFPREEIYGLTSQLRRACASIPTNIAEGSGRESAADFARFLQIAVGSASETEYLILLAHDLKYITANQYTELIGTTIRVRKMLITLLKSVRTSSNPRPITHNPQLVC
ncbi:MAG: four helix bundle protein [Candidatus Poribacteria bacterium]|nr:four helix bundle protein [Candidatus Poribacteria bacterium]